MNQRFSPGTGALPFLCVFPNFACFLSHPLCDLETKRVKVVKTQGREIQHWTFTKPESTSRKQVNQKSDLRWFWKKGS
jgi:hypothetical protein